MTTTLPMPSASNTPVIPQKIEADLAKLPKADRENVIERFKSRKREQQLAAWVEAEYEKCKVMRYGVERKWHVNTAFYMGKQNIRLISSTVTANGFQFVQPKNVPWRVRMVVNKIRPIIRHEIARLSSQSPTPVVVPATTEDEDQAAARVGEQILVTNFNTPEFKKTRRSWIWWGSVCGTSFLKTYWDAEAKDRGGKVGKIVTERVNPFHLYVPDLLEEDIEKQPYVIHITLRTPEQIKALYGHSVEANANAVKGVLEDSFLNLMGATGGTNGKDSCIVIEMWVKKGTTSMMPEGGLIIVSNGKVLYVHDKGNPYAHGEYPFAKYDGIPTGQFYGESTITDLLPLQKNYNRTKSQIIESKNQTSKPQLLAAKGSIDPRKVTSEPGQTILYEAGYEKPSQLVPPPLPQYVLEELDRTQGEMDDISGQHEISRGSNPGQVTAATAISYLQEQDDTKLHYQVTSVEDAIAKVGRQYLELALQYFEDDRLVLMVGQDNSFETAMWQASALKGNTDVRIEAGSSLPQSKAAKIAFVMDLLKLGLLPPDSGLQLLDIGGIEKVYEDYLVDKRQAQRENLKMSKLPEQAVMLVAAQEHAAGMEESPNPLIPVNTWDNHAAHIAEHNRFRKTQQYELLADEIKAEFEKHVVMHQMAASTGFASPVGQMQLGPDGVPVPNDPMMQGGAPNMGAPTDPAQGVPNG